MHAQLTYFDGPRGPELLAAADRASMERIAPAIEAHPGLRDQILAVYALRHSDGGEVIVSVLASEEAISRMQQVIMSTELLPGEDPALLPGPDRIEVYEVIRTYEPAGAPS